MSEIETGFASIFPAGLFEQVPALPPAMPYDQAPGPTASGAVGQGPLAPGAVNVAPGVLNQAVPQGDAAEPAEPGSTVLTAEQTINHGFGLILLLVLIVLGLWLLFRSGQ